MTESALSTARRQVRNRLGKDFEGKASDALVLRLALPLAFSLGKPESVLGGRVFAAGNFGGAGAPEEVGVEAAPAAPESTILEMTSEPLPSPPSPEPGGEAARAALAQLVASLRTLAPGRAAARPMAVIRGIRAAGARETFYRSCGPIREQLGKRTGPSRSAGSGPVTEVCWLNESVRARVNLAALAEVAAHERIQRIGLPRLLLAENNDTAAVLGAPAFRDGAGVSGSGVIVAVIDTEVSSSHPALADRVVQKQNYTKEPWGHPAGHATAVAGIIASSDAQALGIAPGATLYNYKVLATVASLNADDFGGALAIQQALEDGAELANCSWGAGPASNGTSREARACNRAWELGLAIVKSAGNAGPAARTLTTPADAEGVLVVGATSLDGTAIENYSSRGPTADGRARPHLVAPGGAPGAGVVSSLVRGGFGDAGAGTSYAAPHVTGLLALLLEQDPSLRPDDLRNAVLAFCRLLPGGDANSEGSGLPVLS